jgi:DNA invertase Pin-like site-specific DNA recombinase
MARKELVQAVAYLRTSSAANTGADKDSGKRQRAAIEAFAQSAGFWLVGEYYDEAVSGADHVAARPGFTAMMDRIAGNGVRTIIVETANRFARDLIVQETGYAMLKASGVELVAADKPDAFLDDTPTANLIRQVLGAVSEFEKAMVVSKLKGARDRKRATGVKVEGRKNYLEINPDMVRIAKRLHRYPVKGRRRSLRQVSTALASEGFVTGKGKPYAAAAVAKMIQC